MMEGDGRMVTVQISKRALEEARAWARLAGMGDVTDRVAVEGAIRAHAQEMARAAAAVASRQGGDETEH